jgi:ceramide glucosyltransferase
VPADLRRLAAGAAFGAALAGAVYTAFALSRVHAFARRPRRPATRVPTVTILKPLHGDEALLAQKLRSFCDQDYPNFEVVLGARDPADPALETARALAAEFPERVRVVTGDEATPRHRNPKATTLAAMVPHARGELLVIADSDMRVDPDWLLAIVAPFDDARIGAVTCLYRGEPLPGFASRLGAMANHEHFAPSVLVAQALGPLRYTFGSTMAVRRTAFEAIGGLDAIGGHLADDAKLGEAIAEAGLRVELSTYVVENVVEEPTLQALWQHELRWARTHRALRPAGYAGLFITYPLPLAALAVVLARRRAPALLLLGVTTLLRVTLASAARRAFGVRAPATPGLIPLRDAFGLAVWAAAYVGRGVRWRGERHEL